jgi:hypothetical protein
MSQRLIAGPFIISYPNLFRARSGPNGGEDRYSAAFVTLPETDLSEMNKAIVAVGTEKWGDKFKSLAKSGKIRLPIREDGEEKGYPEGSVFFNARSARAPGVVSTIPDKDGLPSAIEDEDEIYPGAVVRASLTLYAYDVNGNRGIGVGLNNVQKIRDGERLDTFVDARSEFDADPNAVADIASLEEEDEPTPARSRSSKSKSTKSSKSAASLAALMDDED